MKKFFVLLMSLLLLCSFSFVGCKEETKLTIATPDGAPTMTVAQLMKDRSNKYSGSIISGTEVAATLTKGEKDFVIAPTNAGMKLAMLNGKYKIIATTSWGNLYLVGTTSIKSLQECSSAEEFLAQLEGASVDSIGSNQVPDVSFKHLLSLANVNCTINAVLDAPTINASLNNGSTKYGLFGEPAITGALATVSGLKRLASISELWLALVGTDFPQASVFAKSTLSEDKIETFLKHLEESINYLNASSDNALELGNYMQNRGDSTLKGAVVKNSYLNMNQKFVLASNCKQDIINFISVLGVNYSESTNGGVFYEKSV